jgi:predicted phosphate transport protein (TIGR00153 family)
MFSFMPRETGFFDLFEQASDNVVEAGHCLKNLMNDFQEPEKQIQHIKDLEHKGDGLTHDLFSKLNKTFITPMDREDIHALASALDDILDEIDSAAELFRVFKIAQPTPTACKLAEILHQSAQEVGKGISLLRDKNWDIKDCAIKVNSLENEADRVSLEAISELFEEEPDPKMVMKWKEIYETFERGTDSCEDVVNVLERITLKNA